MRHMHDQQESPYKVNLRRRKRNWQVALITLGGIIVGATIDNVIGNLGNNVLLWLWEHILASLRADYWPWIGTVTFLIIAGYFWWKNRYLNQAFITSTNLNELDDSLLRLLGSLDGSQGHETQVKNMLKELLRDASREFSEHVQRAYILLPDTIAGEYLRVWVHSKMPDESVNRMRFYIGNNPGKQFSEGVGVAGQVFLEKKSCVAHMDEVNGLWKCDCPSYKTFAPRTNDPVYRSFVCIPIYGPYDEFARKATCLGVVGFDSLNRGVFDSPDTEIILRAFARRIAAAILIYRLLSKLPSNP